jgi:GTP-binding protein
MRVKTATFLKSALNLEDCPRDRRPEIAFAGRSNVGKSTLLNTLLNMHGLAKVSKKPGKTQTLNFFDVNKRVYFVDLPGYGFAQVPRSLQETWGQAVTRYLSDREQLRLVVHLLDSRHVPTGQDHDLLDLLDDARVPVLLVATKVDKLSKTEREEGLATIRRKLDLNDDALIIPFSSVTKEGIGPLWRVLDEVLASKSKKKESRNKNEEQSEEA